MTRTVVDLRSALQELADQATTVDDLDHRPWTSTADSVARSRRRGPSRRVLTTVASAAAVAIALTVFCVTLVSHDNSRAPAGHGSATLEVRPLLAPAVAVDSSSPTSTNPLPGLSFDLPTSAVGYDLLTTAQRRDLQTALTHTDCASQSESEARIRVACISTGGQQIAVLLGPSIFGTDDVIGAEALPPSPSAGQLQWAVALTLDSSAATAWSRYTTAHHANNPGSGAPTQCASGNVPCSDFVAFLVDGNVIWVPLTLAPSGRVTEISGGFNERDATTLAHSLVP